MSKTIEDKAQEFAGINEDKKCNYSFSYNKYDIADAFQNGAEFGYALAENRIKKEYEEKLRWIPVEEKLPENRERVLVKVLRSDKSTIIVTGSVVLDSKLGIYWQSGHATQLNVTHWFSLSFL